MQPWCPFATAKPSPNYSAGRPAPVRAVVLHIAQGSAPGSLGWLTNPASQVSCHFYITKAGLIFQLVSLADVAWCNGLTPRAGGWLTPHGKPVTPRWAGLIPGRNPNAYTVSIEHEGDSGEPLTPAMIGAQTRLLGWLAEQYDWASYRPGENLIGHCHINPLDKPFCPGSAFDFAVIAQRVNAVIDGPSSPPPPPPPPTAPSGEWVTAESAILSAPRCTLDQLAHYLLRGPHGGYSDGDIRDTILPAYWRICTSVGVDPLIAIAQLVVETSDTWHGRRGPLCSWWSQRPRRNPAGIGVTGAPGAGVSFATWTDDAVPAHVGRLLAYATRPGERTADQMALVARAMSYRLLPQPMHGSAPTLKPLGKVHNPTGQGWASPGTDYGAHIARVANEIRGL